MKVTIEKNEGDRLDYETNNISDDTKRLTANAIIHKVAALDIVTEALNFASQAHRASLDKLLTDCKESQVTNGEEKQ